VRRDSKEGEREGGGREGGGGEGEGGREGGVIGGMGDFHYAGIAFSICGILYIEIFFTKCTVFCAYSDICI